MSRFCCSVSVMLNFGNRFLDGGRLDWRVYDADESRGSAPEAVDVPRIILLLGHGLTHQSIYAVARRIEMLDFIIETVKFVGGLGGLASTSFLLYDRIVRYRPTAFLIPVDYKTSLRIKNVADETIIIDEILITPAILKVAKANDLVTLNEEKAASMYPTMERRVPEGIFIVIKPKEERTFSLHRFAEFENSDGKRMITIRCRWRNTRKPFPIARHVKVKSTVNDVRNMMEASLARKV